MDVKLTYNPFTKEKICTIDGKDEKFTEYDWGTEKREFVEWSGDFFKCLEKYHKSNITIDFSGILRDYEYLEDAKNEYLKNNKSVEIKVNNNGSVCISDKLGDLKRLFQKMQVETPYSELKEDSVKDIFEKAVSNDFEMAVIGTVSSGKSTLVNAMLGYDLLPAKTAATTAVITRIHDTDGKDGFEGSCFDKDDNELTVGNPLTKEIVSSMNDNSETSRIEIYGDIKGVDSKDLKLVLTDTPGPNNSQDDKHKDYTDKLLDSDYKPMIIYVLDVGQLGNDDDNTLLTNVAEAMKSSGRQSQERFIFVLNQADRFQDGEPIQKKINDVKKYLGEKGIHNPKVFPACSLLAKTIRQCQNKQKITKLEELNLRKELGNIIKEERLHFSEYAPLSDSGKKAMHEMIEFAKKDKNENVIYKEALVYTGIPAIEFAINEYLTKYALPSKITQGVNAFIEKIDKLELEDSENKRLKENQTERLRRAEEFEQLIQIVNDGNKAKEIKEKIDSFSFMQKSKNEILKLCDGFKRQVGELCFNASDEMSEKDFAKINEKITEMEQKFCVHIQNVLYSIFCSEIETIISDYNRYVSALIGSVSLDSISDNSNQVAKFLGDNASISFDYTIDEYTKSTTVGRVIGKVVGGTIGVAACSLFFPVSIPLAIGTISASAVLELFKSEKTVDAKKIINERIVPKINAFVVSIQEQTEERVHEQETKFKEFFKDKFSKLDEAMNAKLKERESCLKNKEKFEKLIKEGEKKLAWIESFKSDLRNLLAI